MSLIKTRYSRAKTFIELKIDQTEFILTFGDDKGIEEVVDNLLNTIEEILALQNKDLKYKISSNKK